MYSFKIKSNSVNARCVIERTLKAVMNEESKEKKILLLLHHIKETESQRTVEILEKQNQESLRSQLEFHEKSFENQKAKLSKTGQILNSKIMELKVCVSVFSNSQFACYPFFLLIVLG